MHIRKIIIDGFKSYGNRTEIGPFDSQFNAITGLNGTGKSNILDSICFVLGISNLSNVRASSLQDLVYKSGQAGVTKATVTICFDNTNKKTSPRNYESYDEITVTRQIQIGGKNKYLINGVNVQNKKVIDFFISVQLNVNNPNFLIMQGRITKVLNMKPMEILSLIEEAAGTRSYESKKEVANKVVEKKDLKVGEMNVLINDEVGPRLEKLRLDKALFMDYQKLQRDLDLYKRLYVAYRCLAVKKNITNEEQECEQIKSNILEFEEKIKSHEEECESIVQKLQELQERNTTDSEAVKRIDSDIKEHSKKEAAINASYKDSISTIEKETENIQVLQKSLNEDKKILEGKEKAMAKSDQVFQELKTADEKDSKALEIAEKRLMAISAGMSADEEGNTVSVQDQLIKAQGTLTNTQSLCKQYEMELSHYKNELSQLEEETRCADSQYKADQNNLDRLQRDLQVFKSQIGNIAYSESEFRDAQTAQRELTQEVRALRSRLERLRSANQRYEFQYADPEPRFDRSRVRGLFCRLFRPASDEYTQALETCAGGRLFNVVVDTEITGKALIKNGKLKDRVTMIPLNKITGSCIDRSTVEFAKKLVGSGNVHTALDIVNYSEIDEPAMMHVFGGVFVCKDLAAANAVAFHPKIRRRCITLEGDTMDPSGTLSGGAAARGASPLQLLREMDDLQHQVSAKEEELEALERRLRDMKGVADKYMVLKNRIEVQTIELQTVQRRLEMSDFHQHQEEIKKFKQNIESHTKLLKETKNTYEHAKATVKDLSEKVKDAKGYRDKELEQAKTALEKAKRKAEESQKKWQNREQEFQFMTIEISELKKSVEESSQRILQAEEKIKEMQAKSEEMKLVLDNSKQHGKELQEMLKQSKHTLTQKNSDMHAKANKKETLEKDIESHKIEIKKADQSLKKHENNWKESKEQYKRLRSEYDWIKDDEHLFGTAGSCYDFHKHDMKDISRKIIQMEDTKKNMERNLNHKAMSSLPSEEAYYNVTVQKKETVESDQSWLVNTMTVLDNVKKRTLEEAYKQVNKDFGSIFSTLLPGTNAKLQTLPGKSVLEGLEVRVSFNNVWKDSLSELSGGQRSLVALSLILAMLLYKPAPLYILDEVDAALDLSHTQNIGQMLKNHFKSSQFIIVSLKEGMFNNATVLFQTRFINGMSGVIRTVQDQRKRPRETEKDQADKDFCKKPRLTKLRTR